MELAEGTVVYKSRNAIRVETGSGVRLCRFRGRHRTRSSPVVVGDRVVIGLLDGDDAVLEKLLPRKSELTRVTAGGRSLVVAANLDQLLVVTAAREPQPRWNLVDRMLVSAHWHGLEPAICVNKWDQLEDVDDRNRIELAIAGYRALDYTVFALSALRGTGLDPLADWLAGSTTVLSGQSGVGKSTLVNALQPDLDLPTGEVGRWGRGRQITTAVSLHALRAPAAHPPRSGRARGYVADTPGFREYALIGLSPDDLGRYFRDFEPYLPACRFTNCRHEAEPDCAVRAAVDRGEVCKVRFESYLQILASLS